MRNTTHDTAAERAHRQRMTSIRKLTTTTVLPAVLAVALAGPGVATAKTHRKSPGPVISVQSSSPLSAFGTGTAIAPCPSGTGLVGGGFAGQPTPAGSNPGAVVFESHAAGNGWTASAIEDNTAPGSVTAEADCRKHAPPLTQVSGVGQLPGSSPSGPGAGTATAPCPTGFSAVAGGFAGFVNSAGHFVIASSSRRSPDGGSWQVKGANLLAAPDTVTSYAYCAKAHVIEISSTATGTGAGAAISADAQPCPRVKTKVHKHGKTKKVKRSTQPVSGGFSLSDLVTGANGPLLFNSTRSASAWHTGAFELNGGTGTVTGFAYCSI
jgi:hypothetical protein